MDQQMQDQQQKDFLAFFNGEHGLNHPDAPIIQPPSIYQFNPGIASPQPSGVLQNSHSQGLSSQSSAHLTMNTMNMLGNIIQMQANDAQNNVPSSPSYNPQTLLEQQFKLSQLQQLQQLQNQIFQQQIALISGQSPSLIPTSPLGDNREGCTQFTGLPTPGSSAELRPQQQPMDFISPMILNNSAHQQQHEEYHNYSSQFSSPMLEDSATYDFSRSSTSAPERPTFSSPPTQALQSSADFDLDISPLTSPWLGAQQHSHYTNKRVASSSGDEGAGPSRKKQSPAIRPTNPQHSMNSRKMYRGSVSMNSTPLLRSTRSRAGSIAGEVVGDTPSPVEMPPPAPPAPTLSSSSSTTSLAENQIPPSPRINPHLTPVTPASIMDLGHLGINSSLSPPTRHVTRPDGKGRGTMKSRHAEASAASRTRSTRGTSLTSPVLKAILPAGNPSQQFDNTTGSQAPVMHVRKTSHKAAEQKRRDSMKTFFDDLRGLLPPIPLPTDEKNAVEPLLPGALPPRGPPKAGGEGPNKGVSKLQLLMCGNMYIRQLTSRIERRNEEISKLRKEIIRLRNLVDVGHREGNEELDLERDLDADEDMRMANAGTILEEDGEDGEGDD